MRRGSHSLFSKNSGANASWTCTDLCRTYNVDMASSKDAKPKSSFDDIIAVYSRDIDKAALRENLKLTTQERSEKFLRAMRMVFELRRNAPNDGNAV